jgi:hypothetical protein
VSDHATRWSCDFPRSPVISSPQCPAPQRRNPGLTMVRPARCQILARPRPHGQGTWMEEASIPNLPLSRRAGHEVPGIRGACRHISPALWAGLKAMRRSAGRHLSVRPRLLARSTFPLDVPASGSPRPRSAPKIGHRRSQNRTSGCGPTLRPCVRRERMRPAPGSLYWSPEEIAQLIIRLEGQGMQAFARATGDRAVPGWVSPHAAGRDAVDAAFLAGGPDGYLSHGARFRRLLTLGGGIPAWCGPAMPGNGRRASAGRGPARCIALGP